MAAAIRVRAARLVPEGRITQRSPPKGHPVKLHPGVGLQRLVFPAHADAQLGGHIPAAQQPPKNQRLAKTGGSVGAAAGREVHKAGESLRTVSQSSRSVGGDRSPATVRGSIQKGVGPVEPEQPEGRASSG
jgi:hypothetical protein